MEEKAFGKEKTKYLLLVTLLIILLLGSILLSLFVGRYSISPATVLKILWGKLCGAPLGGKDESILWNIRIPRILLNVLVGGGLAIAGTAFQGVFQNPLVSPDVLSVSSGSAFGAVLPEQDVKDTLSRLIAQEAALAVDAAALIKKRRNRNGARIELELSRALSERENLGRLRERLMRDLLSGVLDKEGHDRMKEKYAREGQDLDARIERLQKEQYREKTLLTARNPWIAAFQKHSRKVELTAGLVKSLVERIVVYGENRMEIQLKYRDERAALLAALEQSGEKVSA